MEILVTGGAGFIGSHLVEALVKKKHNVTVLDNLTSGKESNLSAVKDKITFVKGDINDPVSKTLLKGKAAVFHLAAIASVPQSIDNPMLAHEVNATGTLRLLQAAKEANVKKFIYSSTAAVYGDDPSLPKKEDSPICLQSPYAASKFSGEQYALLFNKLYGLKTICLRYFNVYGPRQDPKSQYSGVITKFMALLKENKSPIVFGDGSQTRDFIFVKDVVEANLLALAAKSSGEVYNIASGVQCSVNELLAHLNEVMGTTLKPKFAERQKGDILHSAADISKARELLGFNPQTALHEGLQATRNI